MATLVASDGYVCFACVSVVGVGLHLAFIVPKNELQIEKMGMKIECNGIKRKKMKIKLRKCGNGNSEGHSLTPLVYIDRRPTCRQRCMHTSQHRVRVGIAIISMSRRID